MREVRRILITGAEGYIGRLTTEALAADISDETSIIAADLRPTRLPVAGVLHVELDVTDEDAVSEVIGRHGVDVVIHLAAIVTPTAEQPRQLQFAVDVGGTQNVLAACVEHGVRRFIYTSSGAAYGYHPGNSALLTEDDMLRGNEEFAYAFHKRLVEELLTETRETHPELSQVVFRVSTILGPSVENQITAMFERPVVLGLAGVETPFCFVDDRDMVGALAHAAYGDYSGVFNLTGDGVLTLREIAALMGRRYLPIAEPRVQLALEVLDAFGLAPYGPEQTMFLAHRPVLSNRKLKEELGLRPRSSRTVFERYRQSRCRTTRVGSQTVLLSGAAGGLGHAVALRHAERGDRVVLFDQDSVGLQKLLETLHAGGFPAHAVDGDVRRIEDCRRAVDETVDAFGALDVLYNCAAVPLRGFCKDVSSEDVDRVVDVNLKGAIHMTLAALPAIRRSKGRIVAISSVAGFAPLTGRTAYAASKHGLHGFFDSLRSEVESDGVSVTLACPGYIATGFREGAEDGAKEMSVDEAVRQLMEGTDARDDMILIGRTARLAFWTQRFAPALFDKLMRRSVRTEFPT